MAADDADTSAREHLAALAVPPTPLNLQMAQRVVHQATIEALREYRRTLENPGGAYPAVPAYDDTPLLMAATELTAIGVATATTPQSEPPTSPWSTMTATTAANAFIDANPRTGSHDGNARKKGSS